MPILPKNENHGINRKICQQKDIFRYSSLIYYIEENSYFAKPLNELFMAGEKKECHFVSSIITLIEVLVLPMREKRDDIIKKYEMILTHSSSMEMVDINVKIAKTTARLRADYSLKTPDAIQIATALHCSADYFLTNDKRLKSIKEINIILLEDL
jgi:predicted nucleic acid-binding protein